MKKREDQTGLLEVAERMILAATTAPKGRGVDNLEMAILEREDILHVAAEMERLGQAHEAPVFLRDSANLREYAHLAVIIGTRIEPLGLKYCGLCGFADCAANRAAKGICVFNTGDLGIAVGSAVSVAGSSHADNRVMYTLGMAALSLKLLGEGVKIVFGIPLTATSKNPFFDRK